MSRDGLLRFEEWFLDWFCRTWCDFMSICGLNIEILNFGSGFLSITRSNLWVPKKQTQIPKYQQTHNKSSKIHKKSIKKYPSTSHPQMYILWNNSFIFYFTKIHHFQCVMSRVVLYSQGMCCLLHFVQRIESNPTSKK